MPTSITHQLLAEEVSKLLPQNIKNGLRNGANRAGYYLGAQGPDVCFTYRPIQTLGDNLGSFVHAQEQYLFFHILRDHARRDQTVRAYALGYLTHYAADTIFHPVVYRYLSQKGGRTALHHSIEHAYDGVLLKELRKKNPAGYKLPDFTQANLAGIYSVYQDFAKESGWGEVSFTSFEKAVKNYARLTSVRLPLYRKSRALRARELFETSKDRALGLIELFNSPRGLERHSGVFSMHYLTGEEAKATSETEKSFTRNIYARAVRRRS